MTLRKELRAAVFGVISMIVFSNVWGVDLNSGISIEVKAQSLETALIELSQQAHLQLVIPTGSVPRMQTDRVSGTMRLDTALARILKGSGLTYKLVGDHTIAIVAETSANRPETRSLPPAAEVFAVSSADSAGDPNIDTVSVGEQPTPGRYGVSNRGALVRIAAFLGLCVSAVVATPACAEAAAAGQPIALEEVIVTAEKRSERLQDVPIPVSALNADSLVANGETQLQNYYAKVPGLDFNLGVRGEPVAAIRGIFNIYGNPTIGILIDGIQQGSSVSNGGGYTVPDIDPNELEHIEVLRGPQGTLYGAVSMGGLINYVTMDPSTAGTTGRVEAGLEGIHNGSSTGYSERASLNVPLSDTLALRVSGFTRTDPGYVDNVVTGQRGVNLTDSQGGHLAMLWKPTDDLSLKVSALVQGKQRHGAPDVEFAPGFTDLQQNVLVGTGYNNLQDQAYSVVFTDKIGGGITLKSLSGYNVHTIVDSVDYTGALGGLAQSAYGVLGAAIPEYQKNRRLSEELRLSGMIGERIEWLVGAFYAHEQTTFVQPVTAVDASTGAVAGVLDLTSYPNSYREYSGFADLTVHFTDRFDVQIGGRESRDHQAYTQTDIGAYQIEGGNANVNFSENAFTYLLTPRFKISTDLMAYARLASGFRPGGPNIVPSPAVLPPGLVLPSFYAPDKTENYEVGFKGDFLDHRLSIDTSLYYIDWKNLQLSLAAAGFTYYANGAAAKSTGVELSVQARPLTGLTVGGWIASDDAELTKDLPATSTAYGVSGDRLPLAPRWSGGLSANQDARFTSRVTGFIGASASYVGDRLYNFQGGPQRQVYPAYAKADLHAGVHYDSWTVNAYVNNLADKRGLLGGGRGTLDPQRFTVIQPRTIGLSVSKVF